jgi:hypothetical protein
MLRDSFNRYWNPRDNAYKRLMEGEECSCHFFFFDWRRYKHSALPAMTSRSYVVRTVCNNIAQNKMLFSFLSLVLSLALCCCDASSACLKSTMTL